MDRATVPPLLTVTKASILRPLFKVILKYIPSPKLRTRALLCQLCGVQNRVLWYRYYSQKQAMSAVRGEAGLNEQQYVGI
jgi:hypothetical protein